MTNPATTEIERDQIETFLRRARDLCTEVVKRGPHAAHNAANLGNQIDRYLQNATLARVAALRTQQEPEAVDGCTCQPYDSPWRRVPSPDHSSHCALYCTNRRALPIQQAPQAEAVHQWRFANNHLWMDGAPDQASKDSAAMYRNRIETRTLYTVVTAKAQEDAK